MGNLIKYELKGTRRFMIGLLVAMIIAFTVIQFGLFRESNIDMNGMNYNMESSTPPMFYGLLVMVSTFVIWGGFIAAFFYIVNSFNKEISQDRAYLTFTLPVTGNQILGSKMLVAIIWYLLLGVVILAYNLILGRILLGNAGVDFSGIAFNLPSISFKNIISIILMIITIGFTGVKVLSFIYFSMTLRRISFDGNKMSSLWFIIFIIISSLSSYIGFKVGNALPIYFDIWNYKFVSGLGTGLRYSTMMATTGNGFIMNLSYSIANIVMTLAAFFGTGYLMENKIDL